jgi:stage II sporulation protein D
LKKIVLLAISLMLVLGLWPLPPADAASEPVVQVKLKNYLGSPKSVTLKATGRYSTDLNHIKLVPNHTYQLKVENGRLALYDGSKRLGTAAALTATPDAKGSVLSINDRPYPGSFNFVVESGSVVRPTNIVNIEDYLKGVVPSEMPNYWPLEALKAQAVAARTYVLSYIGKTIDDTINYQVYSGYNEYANTKKAVESTAGQVLKYNGQLISAVFSASNGGMTESNTNAWGTAPLPYLPAKPDPYDPKQTWSFTIHKRQIDLAKKDLAKPELWWNGTKETDAELTANIKNWMKANGYKDKEIKITGIPVFSLYQKTSGKRVTRGDITVEFLIKDQRDKNGKLIPQKLAFQNVPASRIRAMVGLSVMPSYLITSIDAAADRFTVHGAGNGHGVGMSQWGAHNMAEAGKSYKDILKFYYEGTALVKAYDPDPSNETGTGAKPPAKDTKPPVIRDVGARLDAKANKVTLSFTISENAAVTVYVKEKSGKILRYLLNNASKKAGKQTAVWDVTKVNNGRYTFGIIAVDPSKNRASVLSSYTLNKPKPAPKLKTGTVNATRLNVRSAPSTQAKIIGVLKKKQRVSIYRKTGSWYEIKFGAKKGYVSAKYVSNVK